MTALDALYRCQRAWEATQPQLFWTDEVLFDGLDEPQPSALRFVEPAVLPASLPDSGLEPRLTAGDERGPESGMCIRAQRRGTGHSIPSPLGPSPAVSRVLNPGAEPCRGHSYELTAQPAASPAVGSSAAPAREWAGSAPLANQTAPGRTSPEDVRDQGQEVTL